MKYSLVHEQNRIVGVCKKKKYVVELALRFNLEIGRYSEFGLSFSNDVVVEGNREIGFLYEQSPFLMVIPRNLVLLPVAQG